MNAASYKNLPFMFDDNATSSILANQFDKCHTSLVGIISVLCYFWIMPCIIWIWMRK